MAENLIACICEGSETNWKNQWEIEILIILKEVVRPELKLITLVMSSSQYIRYVEIDLQCSIIMLHNTYI